ncbi:MAG: NADH:flavin oxidoreductase [Gammaproteobacteria bacterium]|nr:NADH:flavin oxidoreductase [Gammaproteobacteria bacterium]
MWRPPERIRHDAGSGRWPTAAEAAASQLFQEITLGNVRLAQRTWIPAMVPWRASPEGFVTQNVLDWYGRFAAGRPGAIVVEATGIRDVPSGPLLRIGDDRHLPGLAEIVRVVREASGGQTRIFIQLIDFLTIRRRPERTQYLRRYLPITARHRAHLGLLGAPESSVREALEALDEEGLRAALTDREFESLQMGYRERVTDLDSPQVRDLPQTLPGLFAAAAARAGKAGFDGIELHYAHAYTMASFLSPTNTRTDDYGGDRDARVRLPLEVYAAVRAAVGTSMAVGCRMLAEECIEGGGRIDDAAWFAKRFAQAGMDFISLSRGGKFDDAATPKVGEAAYPYTGPSGYECMPSYYSDARGPFGRNLAASARIRSGLRDSGFATPVVSAGGIHNFEQAEGVLARGEADLVGIARQALADPDWFRKVRSGRGAEVRLCRYTNYCEALDQRHREVTCELWDRLGLEEGNTPRSSDGRRRLVAPRWPNA